jgi:hypothetical protein
VQSLKKVIINIIEPAFDGEVYTEQEVNLMIAGIVVLSEPNREGDKPMHVIGIKSGIHELSMEFPQKIEHAFWGVELSIIESYNKRDFYLHLITLDADGKVVRYSDKIEQSTN